MCGLWSRNFKGLVSQSSVTLAQWEEEKQVAVLTVRTGRPGQLAHTLGVLRDAVISFEAAHTAFTAAVVGTQARTKIHGLSDWGYVGYWRSGEYWVNFEESTHGGEPESHFVDKYLHDPPSLVTGSTHNGNVTKGSSTYSADAVK